MSADDGVFGRFATIREELANAKATILQSKQRRHEATEVALVELRRRNKELQHEKRELNIASVENERRFKAAVAEAAVLRSENEALCRQVEVLQNNRFTEVEELVYLRWVNACLRYELRHADPAGHGKALQLNKHMSPNSRESAKRLMLEYAGPESGYESTSSSSECGVASRGSKTKMPSLVKRLKSWARNNTKDQPLDVAPDNADKYSPPMNSIAASFEIMSRSVASCDLAGKYPAFKDRHKLAATNGDVLELETRSGPPRKPRPPPKPSCEPPTTAASHPVAPVEAPPPPPPPPPPPLLAGGHGKAAIQGEVRRAPEVVKFYQSLMKRDAKREASAAARSAAYNISDARSNMIGEIEKRSSHLLAIKADVETQAELVQSLAAEVRAAAYSDVEDVVAFVNWLDEELSFLVDERAVLKHFDWPEGKADALRECALLYQNLRKLEQDAFSTEECYSRLGREAAMQRMQAALEKIEASIFAVLRTRDMTLSRFKEYNIPTCWMLDSGLVGKIKRASVRLAQHYMRRVCAELDALKEEGPQREFLLLQGVRFAFRVHQFAGGFDRESMHAFEELRGRARSRE